MAIVPIVVGPTGVGKTEIALGVAQKIGAEIVSADSRQVYRQLDIGTAKPTHEQLVQVPHHLVDCVDPDQDFNAAKYGRLAKGIILELLAQGKLPLVVGGSGLYLRALVEGFFQGPGAHPEIRQHLIEEESRAGPGTLHRRLSKVDPESASRIHPHDRVRTIRALEVHQLTGVTLSRLQEEGAYRRPAFSWCKLGLFRERESLYHRIEKRVDEMIEQGLLEEVRSLLLRGYSPELPAFSTVGYREMIAHLKGQVSFQEAVSLQKRNTRQYAKRQMTWFGRDSEILWLHAQGEEKQVFLTIQKLTADQFPSAKEVERRRTVLRRSWSYPVSSKEAEDHGRKS